MTVILVKILFCSINPVIQVDQNLTYDLIHLFDLFGNKLFTHTLVCFGGTSAMKWFWFKVIGLFYACKCL